MPVLFNVSTGLPVTRPACWKERGANRFMFKISIETVLAAAARSVQVMLIERRAASDEDTRGLKAIAAGAPAVTAPTGEDTDMSLVFKVAFLVNVKSMLLVAPALLTTPIVEVKDVSVGPGALSLPVGLAHVVATGANIADAGSMRIGPRDPSLVPILNPPLLFTGQP